VRSAKIDRDPFPPHPGVRQFISCAFKSLTNWGGCGRKRPWLILRYSDIFFEKLKKNMPSRIADLKAETETGDIPPYQQELAVSLCICLLACCDVVSCNVQLTNSTQQNA
jgi:hypothetical protein